MQVFLKNKALTGSFLIFIGITLLFYIWLDLFHGLYPFGKIEYLYNAHHYKQDPRITGHNFSFFNALGQYDGQWYLKIAEQGYPQHPTKLDLNDKKTMDGGLSYNFFPLFPMLIAVVNLFIRNVEVSAFLVINSILVAIFFSLYFVLCRWFSPKVAIRTIFLLSLFPFSFFLRSYYTEALRLLIFIWFCFGIQEKRFRIAAFSAGLLSITSGISLLLLPYFMLLLFAWYRNHKLSFKKLMFYGAITFSPLVLWMLFCFFQTGNPFYFVLTRFAWYRPSIPLLHNIQLLFSLPWLPTRSVYGAKLDVVFILLTILIAFASRKVLPPFVWLTTTILAFSPLVLQDSVSFARFTSVFFPFFAYLAYVLNKKYYIIILVLFTVGLMMVSLMFINWYWVE